MSYPIINSTRDTFDMIDIFRGYNHNLRIGSGEFYDMKNLSSDEFPVLSPRKGRSVLTSGMLRCQGLIAKESLCYVYGGEFFIDGKYIPLNLDTVTQKTMASMGAYVLIFPDKKYINTKNLEDYGDIEASVQVNSVITMQPSSLDGTALSPIEQSSAPLSPEHGAVWYNTADRCLLQYDATEEKWMAITTTYIRISAPGIGEAFSDMDSVKISGVTDTTLTDLNGQSIVWARGDDFIVVEGLLSHTVQQSGGLTVAREMPTMDFVIEAGNRLWGCRYGESRDGKFVNEIYASKLGDFRNWSFFAGVSTDSYTASVGSDGAFTGAINYMGSPLFFKETCMHKVYGTYPSNYQIQDTPCRGVQSGCSRSLAVVNEILYYKARSGVCAYDGSLPVEVSADLGDVPYSQAVAGSLGHKYYISMLDGSGTPYMFVYDTQRGLWHKEDNTRAYEFCSFEDCLYYLDAGPDAASRRIMTINSHGGGDEKVSWMAETGVIGTDSPYRNYIKRIDVRMSLEFDSFVSFYIQYDSCGDWEHVYTANYRPLSSFSVPIRPHRCDHLRIRIVGSGEAKIYSIVKHIGKGSNLS